MDEPRGWWWGGGGGGGVGAGTLLLKIPEKKCNLRRFEAL